MKSVLRFMLLTVTATSLIFGPVAEARDGASCLWWRMAGQQRTRDNGVMTSYELRGPHGAVALSDVEVVFKTTERNGASGAMPDIYAKDISSADGGYRVDIYSGRYERIEILAKARIGGKIFYAKTLLNGYGQSGKIDPKARRLHTMPNWPKLSLGGEEFFFRAQAGTPLKTHIAGGPPAVGIYLNDTYIGTQKNDGEGFYVYTPAHDKKLSAAGYSAWNNLVFVAEPEDGRGVVSLYLPVCRAYYGQVSLRGGLALIGASTLFCFASVWYRGRRFRWN